MKNSDRFFTLMIIVVFALCAIFLYFIFGESAPAPRAVTSGEISLEDEFTDPEENHSWTSISTSSPTHVSSGKTTQEEDDKDSSSYSSTLIADSFSSGSYSKELRGFNSILKQWTKSPKTISLESKQAKLRKRLIEKGFKNQEYIDMKLLALDRFSADKTLKKADELVMSGDFENAMRILKEEYRITDPKNLELRLEMAQAIMVMAFRGGFPDEAKAILKEFFDLQTKINRIKQNTILMENPTAREQLLQEQANLNSNQSKLVDGGNAYVDMLMQNGGFSGEVLQGLKAVSINMVQKSGGELTQNQASSYFQTLDKDVKKAWQNPKSGIR